MIRSKAKYINYDDKKASYRIVLKGKHIGYYKTFEEAVRQRNIWCVKVGLPVPHDVPAEPVPVTVVLIPDKRR